MRPMGDWSMLITLSSSLQPRDLPDRPGLFPAPVEPLGQDLVEGVDDQRRFAGAGNAGDAGYDAEGNLHVDVLEVVLRCADDAQQAFHLRRRFSARG